MTQPIERNGDSSVKNPINPEPLVPLRPFTDYREPGAGDLLEARLLTAIARVKGMMMLPRKTRKRIPR